MNPAIAAMMMMTGTLGVRTAAPPPRATDTRMDCYPIVAQDYTNAEVGFPLGTSTLIFSYKCTDSEYDELRKKREKIARKNHKKEK